MPMPAPMTARPAPRAAPRYASATILPVIFYSFFARRTVSGGGQSRGGPPTGPAGCSVMSVYGHADEHGRKQCEDKRLNRDDDDRLQQRDTDRKRQRDDAHAETDNRIPG